MPLPLIVKFAGSEGLGEGQADRIEPDAEAEEGLGYLVSALDPLQEQAGDRVFGRGGADERLWDLFFSSLY